MGTKFICLFIMSALLSVLIPSCKKQQIQATTSPVDRTDTAKYIRGWLRKYTTYLFYPGNPSSHVLQKGVLASAFFSENSVDIRNDIGQNTLIYGGNIKLNNINLLDYNFSTTNTYYKDCQNEDPLQLVNKWTVDGNIPLGIFPFVLFSSLQLPAFSGHQSLIYNFSKNTDLILKIKNFANTKRIKIYLQDGKTVSTDVPTKEIFVAADSALIVFKAGELKKLQPALSGEGALEIYFYNDEIRNFHGKNIRISNVLREYVSKVTISD